MNKRKQIILLVLLIFLLFIINYPFLDSAVEDFLSEKEIVTRVIDGDTVVINNESIRLLGINCPEKGEKYYQEAKDFLNKIVLDKKVSLEGNTKDIYFRKLSYLFLEGENINLKIIEEGLANVYILDNKLYEKELRNAWENCIIKNKNLCEKSEEKCGNCIELKKLDYKSQEIIFYNKCNFDCDLKDWTIKDEGRKKFIFRDFILRRNNEIKIIAGEGINNKNTLFWKGEDYVWTSAGDTLFLRDDEGKLVLWENY
jgi:micrococcal nuclease